MTQESRITRGRYNAWKAEIRSLRAYIRDARAERQHLIRFPRRAGGVRVEELVMKIGEARAALKKMGA